MKNEELKIQQNEFDKKHIDQKIKESELEDKRKSFVKEFSLEKLKNMPIGKYAIQTGKKSSRESFCDKLQNDLSGLGSIKMGSLQKFGVYFGGNRRVDKERKYRYSAVWGTNLEDSYKKLRKSIIDLISAGERNDKEFIKSSKISNMFKGKILHAYYPDRYLNIFSETHLNHYLRTLGIEDPKVKNIIDKRELLLNFKNNNATMKKWSVNKFATFLYSQIKPPTGIRRNRSSTVINNSDQIDEKPSFVDFKLEIPPTGSGKGRKKRKKTNYIEKQLENEKLGEMGEKAVIKAEKEFLKNKDRADLSDKVEQVSLKDDSLGYDVLSFDLKGNKKFIEVKSTKEKAKAGNTSFIVSDNQIETSKKKTNFFLYIVFEADKKGSKIFKIENPFSQSDDRFIKRAISYRVTINLK